MTSDARAALYEAMMAALDDPYPETRTVQIADAVLENLSAAGWTLSRKDVSPLTAARREIDGLCNAIECHRRERVRQPWWRRWFGSPPKWKD